GQTPRDSEVNTEIAGIPAEGGTEGKSGVEVTPHSPRDGTQNLDESTAQTETREPDTVDQGAEPAGAFNVNDFFGKREQDCRDSCLSDEARDASGNRLPEAMWMGNDTDASLNTCICYNKDLISDETCESDCGLYGNYITSTPHKEAYSRTCEKMCGLIKEMRSEVEQGRTKNEAVKHLPVGVLVSALILGV
ncbi:hypothetical protein FOZ63_014091, partial [Perkinsus olseni]